MNEHAIIAIVGGAINAADKQGIIYLKSVIDGSLKYVSSGKMRGRSWGGGSIRQTKYQD
jgi:hypothetical protein